jgi:hypothetical protein
MEVWSDVSLETGRGQAVLKSMLEMGWLGRLISRRRSGLNGVTATGCSENGEWTRRIQSLSEECEALRRKMSLSS